MKKYVRILSSCTVIAALVAFPATQVGAQELGPQATTQEKIARLVELNPGTTEKEMRAAVDDYIAENGGTFDEVVDEALRGAEEAEAEVPAGLPAAEAASSSGSAQGSKAVGVLPRVRVAGDIFYKPAKTSGIKHGHVGIYSRQDRIVEAPGRNQVSHEIRSNRVSVTKASKIMYVKTSEANRRKAGAYAKKFVGKQYNSQFAFNKKVNGKKMNCSQLVWAAYKAPLGIDLDGNGGPGVYPNNIVKSSKTITWKTY